MVLRTNITETRDFGGLFLSLVLLHYTSCYTQTQIAKGYSSNHR